MKERKALLCNDVDRCALEAQAMLLRQAQAAVNKIMEKSEADWRRTVLAVVNSKPMRERPPVDTLPAYDPQQGALVWEQDTRPAPIVEVDPPKTESDTHAAAEVAATP